MFLYLCQTLSKNKVDNSLNAQSLLHSQMIYFHSPFYSVKRVEGDCEWEGVRDRVCEKELPFIIKQSSFPKLLVQHRAPTLSHLCLLSLPPSFCHHCVQIQTPLLAR